MHSQTVKYFAGMIQGAKQLNRKEKDILLRRLQTQNLEDIARKYKLTAERIRQIEESALIKFLNKMAQLRLFD